MVIPYPSLTVESCEALTVLSSGSGPFHAHTATLPRFQAAIRHTWTLQEHARKFRETHHKSSELFGSQSLAQAARHSHILLELCLRELLQPLPRRHSAGCNLI